MRKRFFYSKHQANRWNSFSEKTTSSTLLIPAQHMEFYKIKLKEFKDNPTEYLSYLLRKYNFLIRNGVIAKNPKLETAYQEEGLNLIRVDFIPKGDDWAEMKCLKAFLNRSMTWIFVQLLLLDSLDITKLLPRKLADFVVPKVNLFRVAVKIVLSRRKSFYARYLHHTRDKAG